MSSPNPESSGPPLRALAMVLISLAILFAAIGALSLTDSDDDSTDAAAETTGEVTQSPASSAAAAPQASAASPAPAATTTASPGASAASTAVDPSDVEVRVLNNSNVAGLAADTASTLTAEGWTIAETGNFAEDQIATTTVYYDTSSGSQAAAREIAQQLGITAEAAPAALASYGSGVIVVVTQ